MRFQVARGFKVNRLVNAIADSPTVFEQAGNQHREPGHGRRVGSLPQQPGKARIGLPDPVPHREYDQGHRRVAHRDCDGVTGAQGLETRRPLLPIARRGIGPENGGAFPHELVDLSRR